MRGIDYRRKQEAKHYNKRIKTSIALKRYTEIEDESGNVKIIPISRYKAQQPWINQSDIKEAERNKNKRWKFQLKNDSLPSKINSWSKRHCRRIRRHFQKLVDYKLPDKKWMVRDEALPRIIATLDTYNNE